MPGAASLTTTESGYSSDVRSPTDGCPAVEVRSHSGPPRHGPEGDVGRWLIVQRRYESGLASAAATLTSPRYGRPSRARYPRATNRSSRRSVEGAYDGEARLPAEHRGRVSTPSGTSEVSRRNRPLRCQWYSAASGGIPAAGVNKSGVRVGPASDTESRATHPDKVPYLG